MPCQILEERFIDAIQVLVTIVEANPTSKAGLSLLGYCCYQIQDFPNASSCYEQLASLFADQEEYKLYWAQSLYQAGLYSNALKICSQITNATLGVKAQKLEAAIKFAEDDLIAAQNAINACPPQDTDTLVNTGCILYKVRVNLGLQCH